VFIKNIVIGAGLSGLGVAENLDDCLIVEKEVNSLGHARSYKVDDFYFDKGAHICHSKNADWLEKTEAIEKSNKIKSNVSNFYRGSFVGYPIQNNLKDLPIDIRIDALTSYVQRPRSYTNICNYRDWLLYQYGEFITDKFYELYTRKYWRTPSIEMGCDWLSGRLIPGKDRTVVEGAFNSISSGAVFAEYYYPKFGGFQDYFSEFEVGKNIQFGSGVKEINLEKKTIVLNCGTVHDFDRLVSTMPITELIDASNDRFLLDLKTKFFYLNLIQTVVKVRLSLEIYQKVNDWFYVYDEDIDFSRVACMNKLNDMTYSNSFVDVYFQVETFRRNDEIVDLDAIEVSVTLGLQKIFPSGIPEVRDIRDIGISYVVPTAGIKEVVVSIQEYLAKFGVHSIGLYGNWEYVWSEFAFKNGVNYGSQLNG